MFRLMMINTMIFPPVYPQIFSRHLFYQIILFNEYKIKTRTQQFNRHPFRHQNDNRQNSIPSIQIYISIMKFISIDQQRIDCYLQLTDIRKMLRSFSNYHQQLNVITYIFHTRSQMIQIMLFREVEKSILKCTIKPGSIKGILGMIYQNNNEEIYEELVKQDSAVTIIHDASDLYLNYKVQYFKGTYQGRQKLETSKYLKENFKLQPQIQWSQIQQFPQHTQDLQVINMDMNQVLADLALTNNKQAVSQLLSVNDYSTWLVNKSNLLFLELPEKAYKREYNQAKNERLLSLQMRFNQHHEIGTEPRYYLALGFVRKSSVEQIRQNYDKKKTISIEFEFMNINTCIFHDLQVNSNNYNISIPKNISVSAVLNNIQNKIQVYYQVNKLQFNMIQKQLQTQQQLIFDELIPFIYLKESFLHFQMNWFK